jgi:hypothetical protein
MRIYSLASISIAAILALGVVSTVPAFAHQEHIDFITNVEYIKGHLEQVVANKQAGNTELAIAHAGHPIEEVFALIEGPLLEASSQRAADLEGALEDLPNSIESDTAQAVSQKVANINGMLDEAVEVFAGEEAEELATKAGVISGLLETAEHEYEEAVANGEIVEMIEYQDASAFISRAKATFETVKAEIDAHEAEEIEEFFGELDSSLEAKAEPANIETLVDGIIHELGEVVPSSNEHVEFAANLEFIKGHLSQAVSNKQAGQTELAITHAGHPIVEIYSLIEGELAEHNAQLNTQLKESLTKLANEIQSTPTEAVQTQVAEINGMLNVAKDSVIGEDERNDPKFNAMVAISLLETAEHEYEEAVSDDQIVEMVEYQDSTAFIARAEAIFNVIKTQLPGHEAEEIEEFFGQLNSLTESNASVEEVETTIGGIVHEFKEAVGLEGEEEGKEEGNWAYIDRIVELLDQSVAEYKQGNSQRAKALAIEAYLDNYEFIESDIAEENRELMEKIEIDMRVELVQMIDAARPAAEVESHVDSIKTDLETARAVVTPEFPLALLVLGSVAATILAGTLYTRRRGGLSSL